MLNFISINIYNSIKMHNALNNFKQYTYFNVLKSYELKNVPTFNDTMHLSDNIFCSQTPANVSKHQMLYFKLYLEYANKTFKFLRILYNLPVRKIKTHNVSRKKKWIHTNSIKYCIKQIDLFKKLKLPKNKIQMLFFCEYINSIWFFNWWSEWHSAYKSRIKFIRKNVHIKWNYDYKGLIQGNIIHFLNTKKKAKHNRRKQIVSKNSFNVGFSYGFTNIYFKKIMISVQKPVIKNNLKNLKKKK